MISVDIVLPCYNEAEYLIGSVNKLISFLVKYFPFDWKIIIAENGSSDNTLQLANEISHRYVSKISVISNKEKGRGRALLSAWKQSKADIVSYMDADLSTDVSHFPLLIEGILKGADITLGNRLSKESNVKRTLLRTILSVSYNFLIRYIFRINTFSDAQCGFKAAKRAVIQKIFPEVKNKEWFFDTELLVLADKKKYIIKEIPIAWNQRKKSTVKILKTIFDDIIEIIRLFSSLRKQ